MDVAERVGSLHVGVAALLDVVEEAATLSPELSSLRDALTVAESHLAAAWDLAGAVSHV